MCESFGLIWSAGPEKVFCVKKGIPQPECQNCDFGRQHQVKENKKMNIFLFSLTNA